MRSQRNSLKYNVHYRGKNSIAGSQEDMKGNGGIGEVGYDICRTLTLHVLDNLVKQSAC